MGSRFGKGGAQSPPDDEDRLKRIETKLSFAEDLLDALNRQVFRQQEQIDRLQVQLLRLAERADQVGSDQPRHLRDEIPPHY